jgi:cytochrome P450
MTGRAVRWAIDPVARRLQLSPRDLDFVQDPFVAYRAMRDLGPAFFWEDYGIWCCAGADDVGAALRERRLGRELPTDLTPAAPAHLRLFHDFEALSLLEREPPAHTRLRNLVSRAFVSRRIAGLEPAIAACADGLIDSIAEAGKADLLAAYAEPIPVVVICDLIGAPREMSKQLLAWSHAMVAMYQFRRDRQTEDAAVAATLAFQNFIRRLVGERRARPRDDLISHLIAARDGGEALSEDELVVTCILLLNAGHEATVHAIANGIFVLLDNDGKWRSGLGDPGMAERIVEESLRFEPPLHLFTRYALTDLDFAGLALKRGDKLGVLLASANRDPRRFADPDRFDALRPPAAHLAFGAGIHFCLGAPLARLEITVALRRLFLRLPSLALAEVPRWRDIYHFRALEHLNVTVGAAR